jgi:cytochrome c oxidase subunit 3
MQNEGQEGGWPGSAAGAAVEAEPSFSRLRVAVACLLTSEAVFFSTLIVAYLKYLDRSVVGPTPAEALRLPLVIVNTICLLSSSATMVRAVGSLRRGDRFGYGLWLVATMLLALEFLGGTAWEWVDLIVRQGLLPSTNLFGSTFYTLVGFHSLHVAVGILVMAIVLGLVAARRIGPQQSEAAEMVSWYWHFVDGVWVVIFSIVYVYGR